MHCILYKINLAINVQYKVTGQKCESQFTQNLTHYIQEQIWELI